MIKRGHDVFSPDFRPLRGRHPGYMLDLRAGLHYLRAMLSVRTVRLSCVRRGRAAGPGALRMR
jgi:hypothetical protein